MLLLHGPRCNLGELYRGCPVVVQYWADLQSVHEFRYYDNIARTRVSKCLYTRSIPGYTLLTLIRGSTNSCSPILTRRLTLSVTGDDHVSCMQTFCSDTFLLGCHGQLADATGDFACLVFVFWRHLHARPRVVQLLLHSCIYTVGHSVMGFSV